MGLQSANKRANFPCGAAAPGSSFLKRRCWVRPQCVKARSVGGPRSPWCQKARAKEKGAVRRGSQWTPPCFFLVPEKNSSAGGAQQEICDSWKQGRPTKRWRRESSRPLPRQMHSFACKESDGSGSSWVLFFLGVETRCRRYVSCGPRACVPSCVYRPGGPQFGLLTAHSGPAFPPASEVIRDFASESVLSFSFFVLRRTTQRKHAPECGPREASPTPLVLRTP